MKSHKETENKRQAMAKLSEDDLESIRENKNVGQTKHKNPDSAWGWFVVFNSFLCNMIVDGMQYTFGNFLLAVMDSLDSSLMEVSLIGSLLSGFYNFSGPIAGALGNKFGFRMVAIAGSLLAGSGLMLSYFAHSIYYLYFFYGILGGLGFGMIYMASVITTSIYFEKYRALAASISVSGTGFGTFVFAPLGTYLVTDLGWRWALVIEGGIVLACILFGLSFKAIQILKMVPVSVQASEMALGGSQRSIYYCADRRKTMQNNAYPTLKEAMAYQDDRRSTIVSLMPKSQLSSRSVSVNSSELALVVSQLSKIGDSNRAYAEKNKCKKWCGVCCFNFWHCSCKASTLTLGDRPMYRDDVFYGSNLSQLKFSPNERLKYHLSVTRIPDPKEVEEHQNQKCCVCHHAVLRTCMTMTGMNLFKSKIFMFLCISSFIYTMALYVPYVFIRELADECHVDQEVAVWLVSAIGISNTVGRLVSGFVNSLLKINSALITLISLFISGSFSFIFLFYCDLSWLFAFSCVFGFFTAPFVSLRPVIIVDFLGLDKLTNAFGLVLLTQGVASILGPPIAGVIVAQIKNYEYVMYFSGGLILLSALALLTSAIIHWKEKG